ncbi:MAG: helix-turn-helix domain-containing protein [Treponema sp.]|nr:helix-turn-helix domain-containing protein [Treponema sp.]
MESYGALLKKTRESLNIDVETVERNTSITRRYIEALESEDVTVFPGEPYLYGFLRNYAEYLGLNPDTVAALYKNKVIQESPIPEGLYEKHRSPWIIPAIVFGCLVLVGGLSFVGYKFVYCRIRDRIAAEKLQEDKSITHTYELTNETFQQRLYKGDQIIVPDDNSGLVITIAGTLGSLALDMPSGRQMVDLSEEAEIDADGDAVPEFIIYVSDVSRTNEERGAEVKILLKSEVPEKVVVDVSDIPTNSISAASQKQTVVFTDNRAYPFTINITFRGSCEFRFVVDRADAVENYYASGEVISMTPQNAARLWMSNGNAVKTQIIANGQTYNLDIAKAGQVVVQDIKWIKDVDGLYKVVIEDID